MALHEHLDHGHVIVDQVRADRQAIVIDDRIDFSSHRCHCALNRLAQAFDILHAVDRQPGQIDIEHVVEGVVSQSLIERTIQQRVAQLHRLIPEDPRIHELWRMPDDRFERHPFEDIGLQVDSGGHFDQFQPLLAQPEHATLGHVKNLLSPRRRVDAAKRPVLDTFDKFLRLAFGKNLQLAARHANLEPARREGSHEHHFLGALRDVDEAARARQPRTEFRHIEIALVIRLREPQDRQIQAAPVVEIKLAWLIDDRLRVGGRAEIQAARRYAADHARLGRHREQVENSLLGRDGGNTLRHADPEVDDRVGRKL